MKTLQLFLALLLMNCMAYSQNNYVASVSPTDKYKTILTDMNYTITDQHQYDIRQDTSYSFYKTFNSGNTYDIIAFSDESGCTDLNIALYKMNGRLYKKSRTGAILPEVTFKMGKTRTLKVVFKNYATANIALNRSCKSIISYKMD